MTRFIAALALVCVASIPARAETCIASQYGVGDGYHGKRAATVRSSIPTPATPTRRHTRRAHSARQRRSQISATVAAFRSISWTVDPSLKAAASI
jgi:hypothetical protein